MPALSPKGKSYSPAAHYQTPRPVQPPWSDNNNEDPMNSSVAVYLQPVEANGGDMTGGSDRLDLTSLNSATTNDVRLPLNRATTSKQVYSRIIYGIHERPAWYMCILLGLQHFIIMFGATSAYPLIIASSLCLSKEDKTALPEIIGTTFFCCGISTLLQSFFGVRLPIIQGGSFVFIMPVQAIIKSLHVDICTNATTNMGSNSSSNETYVNDNNGGQRPWKLLMLETQGAIMLGSLVEIFIGCTGE
jgi:nucleobase transporter 1/2